MAKTATVSPRNQEMKSSDTETGKEVTDQSVVISVGKLSNVEKSEAIPAPEGAHIVDGRGKFLMPGLWDMHVHIFGGNRFSFVSPGVFVSELTVEFRSSRWSFQ